MKKTILVPGIIILCAVSAAQTANVEVVPAPRVAVTQVTGSPPTHLLDNIGRIGGNLTVGVNVTFSLPDPLTRILFQWMSSSNGSYTTTAYGPPSQYVIEYSTDSTNGTNGIWRVAVNETNNVVAARAHVIQSGSPMRYVRFRITGGTGTHVDEIDIHDLTKGQPGDPFDTWGFIGDSLTAAAYWRDPTAGTAFNKAVNLVDGERYPSMINFGVGSNTAGSIYDRLQRTIDLNPGIHFWAIGVGTNDTSYTDAAYRQNLTRIVEMLISNGKQPIITRIPFTTIGTPTGWGSNIRVQALNVIVEEVRAEFGLPVGPDLYTYFQNNPSQLYTDGVHHIAAGWEGMNKLWADVALTIPKRKSTAVVGAQSGDVKAGEGGSVTFPVTTAGISDGTYQAVLNGAPAGVSGSVTMAVGNGTLTVNTTAAAPSGRHRLTLTIGGVTSNSFNLAIGKGSLDGVKYYPNPIQPSKGQSYSSMQFSNISAGTHIKIYTLLGQAVRELEADASGIAVWDGKNNSGEKAASGVYIVYMEDGDGNKKRIKIAVER